MSNLDLTLDKSSEYSLFRNLPGVGIPLGDLFSYDPSEKSFFSNIQRKLILFLVILTLTFIVPYTVSKNSEKDYPSVLWPSLGVFTSFWSLGLITLKPKGIV